MTCDVEVLFVSCFFIKKKFMEKTEKILVEVKLEKEQNEYMLAKGWLYLTSPDKYITIPISSDQTIKEISEALNIIVHLTGKEKKIQIP